jgi:hypothetical protein
MGRMRVRSCDFDMEGPKVIAVIKLSDNVYYVKYLIVWNNEKMAVN